MDYTLFQGFVRMFAGILEHRYKMLVSASLITLSWIQAWTRTRKLPQKNGRDLVFLKLGGKDHP